MMSLRIVVLGCLGLGGCVVPPGGPTLVSAQFPPGTGAVNDASQPQPIGSLPVGAANLSLAPGATQPSYGSFTFKTP